MEVVGIILIIDIIIAIVGIVGLIMYGKKCLKQMGRRKNV